MFSRITVATLLLLATATSEAFVPTCRFLLPKQQQQQKQQAQQRAGTSAVLLREMQFRPLRMSSNEDEGWESGPKSAMIAGAGVSNAGEPPFEIRGFSLGNVAVAAGILILTLSFWDYLSDTNEGLNVSGLGFVYGIPILLTGAALKYAEIDPIPVVRTGSDEELDALFEAKATEIIRKIKQDVTRHRYGDEAHMDTTLKKLGLVVPGKDYPQLKELREEKTPDGELAFTMVWQSTYTPYKMWADERRVKKYNTFFGQGVKAEVVKIDAEQRLVGIKLTTVSGDGVKSSADTSSSEKTEAPASFA